MSSLKVKVYTYSESATIITYSELSALQALTPMPITRKEILANMIVLNGVVYSLNNNGKKRSISEISEALIITGKSGTFYA
ncbi:hypothetical protein [Pedobacter heparinus]|uniref:Uncharacterized protein n=1 Tax=Pedobacter heparinus (strain ATCC 13125 / DSM 2366 / CIP 104194 / JCM 7457 / NBRC 12017 / NCIMB 9290 / NRRL B-14731 / HIM 762-3) TaxID=485917 RepID=C6XVR1_PEDHD|nr:hypothetical protein [Pedobacter heparinus]ACU06136.1 hypothetical protein Phep_3945 [Pedobacter heparinus DSM 2366]